MNEEEWFSLKRPHRMLKHLEPTANDRQLRLLVVACERYSHPHMSSREQAILSAIERIADGVVCETDSDTVRGHYLERFFVESHTSLIGPDTRFPFPAHRSNEYERIAQCALIRDIFGNPFRPVVFSADWRSTDAVAIARTMYESRDFGAMPILADALQDAGCDNEDILSHCRDTNQTHVRGCWVVDLVLGKD